MDTLSKLKSVVSGPIIEGEILARHTSFRIGGPAKYFIIANSKSELIKLIDLVFKFKIPYLVIGGGTNILFADTGFDGLVIKFNDGKFKVKGQKIEVNAGAPLSKVVGEALSAGLSGLEWAVGIPGTIGGAVVGNAGAFGGDMAAIVESVEIIRNNKIRKINNKKCGFIYRASIFKNSNNHDIVLSISFNLKFGEVAVMKEKMVEIISQRKQKDDKYPSAGSVFKNIKLSAQEMADFIEQYPDLPEKFINYLTIPAAWLIDKCGLKGKKIGGAMVSEFHSGRIINIGQASAEDVIMLISVIKQKVRSKFSLQLMEEIEYQGF